MTDDRRFFEKLARLQPLAALAPYALRQLAPTCRLEAVARSLDPFRLRDWTGKTIFLFTGQLKIDFADGSSAVLVGGTGDALSPLAAGGVQPLSAKAITDIELLYFDEATLDIVVTWDQIMAPVPGRADTRGGDWRTQSGIFAVQALTQGAFAALPAAHIHSLFERFQRIKVARGEVVVREGDAGDFYYLIEQGRCLVTREVAGSQVVLAELAAGDAFGEEALVTGGLRNATVTMKTGGILQRLAKADFDELLRSPLLRHLDPVAAEAKVAAGALWLDVRFPAEYLHDGLPGAINIPINEIRQAFPMLDNSKEYVVYCQSGRRSSAAAFLLSQRGFRAYLLDGGAAGVGVRPAKENFVSTVVNPADPGGLSDVGSRLIFFKNLQAVTNKVHATANIDEIMLELSQDICELFNAERLTIYSVNEDRSAIISKVKTGLNSFKDLRLPVSDQSIAGYVAQSHKTINIRDVYDDAELKAINSNLRFLQEVDRRTGYRTKQMLISPIVDTLSGELYGVVQIINNKTGAPFAAVAEEGIKGLCETLAIAFTQRHQTRHVAKSKYDYLVLDAVLSAQELELATRTARRNNVDIEEVLLGEFMVKPAAIGDALAKFFNVPYEGFQVDRLKPLDLLKNLKRDYVEQNHWLPVEDTAEGVVILAMDPEQVRSSGVVQNVFPRRKLVFHVTTRREFQQSLDQLFSATSDEVHVGDLLSDMEEGDNEIEGAPEEVSAAADNELVKLVNKIIVDAHQQGASDIHIEPGAGKDKVLVRFRRDGSLFKYIEVPASYRNAIVARIKIMCDLDISEKRRPQDGKIKFKRFGPLDIELRVATIPSAGGVEDVVMRILAAGEPIPLEKLGVAPGNLEKLKACVAKPYGIFFVCGPTGSGKTTTLHSVLASLNTPDTKIWTAEDPVEITQKGLRQVQINKKAGIDFSSIMRSFLRADPDIIMVGEMRDKETTSIGIEASLTGHLVFATLHTNSAPESVVRLLDMGMDPFNFADALLGILAQRLAKRLCPKCREAYKPAVDEMKHFLVEYCEDLQSTSLFKKDAKAAMDAIYQQWLKAYGKDGQLTLYRPKGCEVCGNTGYKGRVAIHELMVGSDEVKRLIQDKARVALLLVQALEDGMRTLKQDGMEKVLQGITDMKQVRAVCIK